MSSISIHGTSINRWICTLYTNVDSIAIINSFTTNYFIDYIKYSTSVRQWIKTNKQNLTRARHNRDKILGNWNWTNLLMIQTFFALKEDILLTISFFKWMTRHDYTWAKFNSSDFHKLPKHENPHSGWNSVVHMDEKTTWMKKLFSSLKEKTKAGL